jgi:hypothetical protein
VHGVSVTMQGLAACREHVGGRADPVQPERLGHPAHLPGRVEGSVDVELLQIRPGQLEVEHGDRAEQPQSLGDAPRVGQPLGAGVIQQVHRAEFVQSAQLGHRQVGATGDLVRALECPPGALQIVQPVAAAHQFESVADGRSVCLITVDITRRGRLNRSIR